MTLVKNLNCLDIVPAMTLGLNVCWSIVGVGDTLLFIQGIGDQMKSAFELEERT